MTVSTSYGRTYQVQDIVRRAYQMAGLKMPVARLNAGITNDEMQMAMDFLEARLDELQAKGTAVRFRDWKTLTLTSGLFSCSFTQLDTIDVEGIAMTYVNATTDIQLPCYPMTGEEYFSNPAREVTTGRPVKYYVHRTTVPPTLYVWPVPDQTYTFKFRQVRASRDVDLTTATVDLEFTWNRWLVLSLAADLAEANNKPSDHVSRLEGKAQSAEAAARNYSRPHGAMQIRLSHRGPWR